MEDYVIIFKVHINVLQEVEFERCRSGCRIEIPWHSILHCCYLRHPLLAKYPELCIIDGSRSIEGYDHKPNIDPNVPPIAQPLRRIPVALDEQVCKKLDEMENAGILEKIESSP